MRGLSCLRGRQLSVVIVVYLASKTMFSKRKRAVWSRYPFPTNGSGADMMTF